MSGLIRKSGWWKRKMRLALVALAMASLVGLLVVQVRWLEESIRTQEAIFSKSVNMALSQTIKSVSGDETLNLAMQNAQANDSTFNSLDLFDDNVIARLDSTIEKELALYHIDIDFHFMIINGADTLIVRQNDDVLKGKSFQQSLKSPGSQTKIDFDVHFPGQTRFILKSVRIMFVTSVVLILFTFFSVILIVRYYLRERYFAERIKDMVGNLTHEFMTPISSISLAGNMILRRNEKYGDQSIVQFATAIKEENRKLQLQVERLLQMAAVEKGSFDYNKTPVDIHALINEAIKSLSFQLRQKDGEVVCDFQADNPVIEVDRMHFLHVFINLIGNSIKYSREAPLIRIITKRTGQKLEISVQDNGIGIPAREHRRIFEKYYRIQNGNKHNTKGFGIGLYYVKAVVKGHRGSISVVSTPGEGSTFTIVLPAGDGENRK